MLTVYRNQEIFELEKEFPKIDIHVMSEEYERMERRLEIVTEETVSRYLNIFGYDGICFEGAGPVINGLKGLSGKMVVKEDSCHKILRITEHIETRNSRLPYGCYDCGIRDVLYEMKEFAAFPKEIEQELKYPGKFRDFAKRTVEGLRKNGWRVMFSDRTPLSEWICDKCDGVQYIEDITESCTDGEKIFVFKNGNLSGYHRFYKANKKVCRIESFRRIEVVKNWTIELLCGYFREELKKGGVTLYIVSREWAFNHPLFPLESISTEQLEQRSFYNRSRIHEDYSPYILFLKKIYGKKYSPDYVKNVTDIPKKLDLSRGKVRCADYNSRYLNVVNGERYTAGNPINSRHSIYLLGSCLFFGNAVEDSETVASFLQKKINEVYSDWRVVNIAMPGARIYHIYKVLYEMRYRKGDIVIIDYGIWMPLRKEYKKCDITMSLNDNSMKEQPYFDSIIHCSHTGYALLADKLWTIIRDKLAESDDTATGLFYLTEPRDELLGEEQQYYRQAMEYINMVKANTPEGWDEGVRGAIVMNCNPFTLGHQYLIRQSAAKVDHLYIFVVEEDKSFFPFKDRIELVRAGTRDIKNVVVVPSGKLIISTATFPGYFSKDSPDSVGVDTSLDVDIFGRYIAAPLGITKRFVGEEPIDMVTRSYNESMKEILPKYGIEVEEIKRKEQAGGVISASRVRKALQTGDFELVKILVPDTTYEYLWKNRERYMRNI